MTKYLLAYGIGLNLFLLGFALFGMKIPIIAQLIHVLHWGLLSAWLALPLYLSFLPNRAYTLILGLPLCLSLYWYGEDYLPRTKPSHAEANSTLTLATFNLEGNTSGVQPALESILRDLNADVVGLQEVAYADRVRLARNWAEDYPYQAFAIQSSFDMIGILSRYPILETTYPNQHDFLHPNRFAPRHFRAVIDYHGQKIAVYVFHPMRPDFQFFLSYNDERNRVNFQQLLVALSEETYPTLVLCDCNTSPRTPQYQQLAAQLNDLHPHVGWGLGLTHSGLPWLPFRNTRIDYIWFSDAFTPLQTKVWHENGGSDHHPLWGKLKLP